MSVAVSRRWLVLRLEAPLVAFGGVTIDHIGVTRDFPALSALTGLFANALGYDRKEKRLHKELQDRLVFAVRREREPDIGHLRDMQNVQGLGEEKRGWTTRGTPEERGGGSLDQTHRRERDYHPDAALLAVVTLTDTTETPTLDDLAAALDSPARPLFIGRKPCLPSWPIRHRLADGRSYVVAITAHAALCALPEVIDTVAHQRTSHVPKLRAMWPADEGPADDKLVDRALAVADRRNWISGLHGGTRAIVEGRIVPALSEATP